MNSNKKALLAFCTTVTLLCLSSLGIASAEDCPSIRVYQRKYGPWANDSQIIESQNFYAGTANNLPKYPPNIDCVVTIGVPEGDVIYLRFVFFDLEYHPFCEYDSLTVYDGDSTRVPKVGTFCGKVRPLAHAFTSTTNKVTFHFISDDSGTRKGFQIEAYQRKAGRLDGCGGRLNSDVSGLISSPADTEAVDCIWDVQMADSDKVIQLELIEMSIPESRTGRCTFNGIEIIDGSQRTDLKLVENLCGTLHATAQPIRLVSSSNKLRIRFYASPSNDGLSFKLTYKTIPRSCGGMITVTDRRAPGVRTLGMPSGPAVNCRWTLKTQNPDDHIHLFGMSFMAGPNCTNNYALLRDLNLQTTFADMEEQTHLRRLCNSGFISKEIYTDGNEFEIYLKSDGTSAISFSFSYEIGEFPRSYNDKNGIIRSPGYPNLYSNNLDIIIHINQERQYQRVAINFHQLDLEESKGCRFDYIQVHDGNTTDSPSLAKLCGLKKGIRTLYSSGQYLTLHFVADRRGQGHGFEITYTSPLSSCGGTLGSAYGTFYNPPNLDSEEYFFCFWRIELPEGMKANLTFSELNVQIPTSNLPVPGYTVGTVTVRDGPSVNSELIGTFVNTIPDPIVSSTNQLYIELHKLDLGPLLSNAGMTGHYTAFYDDVGPSDDDYDYRWGVYINGEDRVFP